MAWTAANPVSIGNATKKVHFDSVFDNADYLMDYIKGDNGEGSGATGHDHDGTDSLLIRVSATNKVLGRSSAGAGTVEELACTSAGRALIDDADAAAQRTTLGLGSLAVLSAVPNDHVTQAMLHTATGEVSTAGNELLTLPGGEYGFYPQTKTADASYPVTAHITTGAVNTSYATIINLVNVNSGSTVYAQQRYVTTSGKDYWMFLLLNDKNEVIATYSAPDHPSYGNGNDENKIPHPFVNYYSKPLPESWNIVLLDMDSTRKILVEGGVDPQRHRVDMSRELPWVERDMDGKRKLASSHNSYSIRRLI